MYKPINSFAGYTLLFTSILMLVGCSKSNSDKASEVATPPLNNKEALASIEVIDGFKVELFADEPMIQDPVAMEVDEEGRIYVVEMRSYPLDASGLGRVKLLEDTNSDGFPDSYTIFADSLMYPNGVMRWKEGVLITDAPHLYYMEDTTGDGKADKKEIILTGFALSNPQVNFNTPIYGLDNWIHIANNETVSTDTYSDLLGDKGSRIEFYESEDAPDLPQNAGGRNIRFKPDSLQIEMKATSSQYGQTFDAWGNNFLVSNARHQYFEAIESKYVERNPGFFINGVNYDTPDHGNAAEVYPTTLSPEYQLLTDRGVITSASGITYYLGGAFPEEFNNVTFVAESVHNLVHADVVEGDGTMFKASRLLDKKEFLTSTDAWFRPVQFYIGPDGALYVIDYYRRIIDHPQWLDDETAQNNDLLYEATNRGRIYRVVPDDMGDPEWVSNLDLNEWSTTKLVALFESPNIWWRRNAQRLLMDRNDAAAIKPLKDLVFNSKTPTARLHALWTLDGLGELDSQLITAGLQDEEAGVRENAIKLAEKRFNENPSLVDKLLVLVNDPSLKVRYQLLLSLGDLSIDQVNKVREEIVFDKLEDPWIQIAFLSAEHLEGSEILYRSLHRFGDTEKPGRGIFLERIASIIGAQGSPRQIRRHICESLTEMTEESEWWRTAILAGIAGALQHADLNPEEYKSESRIAINTFFETDSEQVRDVVVKLIEVLGIPEEEKEKTMQQVLSIAADRNLEDFIRADAIGIIAMIDPLSNEKALKEYSSAGESSRVQQAAIDGLGKISGLRIGTFLLNQWREMAPAVRDKAVNVLIQEKERVELLLNAVEENEVSLSDIGWSRRVALMQHSSDDIRERARKLLRENPEETADVLNQYREALTLKGNMANGKEIYKKICSACHQVREDMGTNFGPDLATVRHWEPQALMSKVLDPNRSVADGYEMMIVERNSGSSVAGVIHSENSGSVTLRNAGGVETTIPRSDIKSISSSNASPMPSGLENEISKQEMADLIAYIRQL